MRISLRWLAELVDYELPAPQLAKRLNDAGLETATIDVYGSPASAQGVALPPDHLSWDGITVGEVIEVKKHPNADRLRIAIVDCGHGPQQSVTGAPNIAVGSSGQRVAVAGAGARVVNAYSDQPAPTKVRPAKLRGEPSEIVLCSERELDISTEHEGIVLLDADAPVGAPLSEVWGDVVLEVEITPNLSRCLNMVGIAREVAALAGGTLNVQPPRWQAEGAPIENQIQVEVEDPQQCARYACALIKGIRLGPSPFWMRYRLTLAGMRPINNVVDITNYVMLEWGQPLHAFDYRALRPQAGADVPTIRVRNARAGEALTTLDGAERTLDPEMLLIADGVGPIALAGGMGGLDTEVGEHTVDILLESANFNAVNNRRTAQKLKLFSEASSRFSKGLPPELAEHGLKRAAEFMRTLAGGTIAKGVAERYPLKPTTTVIQMHPSEPNRLLGTSLSTTEVVALLLPLGFGCEVRGERIEVTVPSHRLDVKLPADLVEEVARMVGYDKLPTRLLQAALPTQRANPALQGKLRVKHALTQLGLSEVINYTLTDAKTVQRFERSEVDPNRFVQLKNTLSSERSLMRRALLPGLLETAALNRRYQERVALFEIGRVFWNQGDPLPEERSRVGLVLSGQRSQSAWLTQQGTFDFFDLKGVVEGLLQRLHVEAQTTKGTHPSFHPGRCAELRSGDDVLGTYGELHPRVAEAFGLEGRVCAAEFELELLLECVPEKPDYAPPPRFPAVSQDVALVVDAHLPHAKIEALILELGKPLLRRVALFDLYTGDPIPEGKRSLAYALTYQASDRTLTDEEVATLHERVQAGLQEHLGADIRGL